MKIKLYEFLEKKIETINYEKILSTFIVDKLKLKLSKDSKSYRTKISDGNEEENKRILSSIFPKASTKIYVTKAKENEKRSGETCLKHFFFQSFVFPLL